MNAKLIPVWLLLSVLFAPAAAAQKSIPVANFKPDETLFYHVHLKTDRNIKTKSALALPEIPTEASVDVNGILQVEIVEHGGELLPEGSIALRTWFITLVSDIGALQRGKKPDTTLEERLDPKDKVIYCTIQPDGRVFPLTGLNKLAPEEQAAWREWATHFAGVFQLEWQARKRGEKWSSEEPETSPAPIAELFWQKKSQYVQDEACATSKFDRSGEFLRTGSAESCAVILTDAKLGQKSSQQDSTPPDYKVKGLKTRGTVKGNNQTILYISRKTGRLIRATQDAKQQMDVTITLASANNNLHYEVLASAKSTVEIVTDLPLILQPKSGH